jgi:hypothetical protein
MIHLHTSVDDLPGVSAPLAARLRAAGMGTVRDLRRASLESLRLALVTEVELALIRRALERAAVTDTRTNRRAPS